MKIQVSNIDRSTSEDELYDLFEEFGSIASLELNEEPDPGKETFSAIVDMVYEEDAEEAIEELNGERVDGRILRVVPASKASEAPRDSSRLDYLELEEDDIRGADGKILMKRSALDEAGRGSKKPTRRNLRD